MQYTIFITCLVATLLGGGLCGESLAELDAKIEVFDPRETWIEGENWGIYVRVTNTGTEAFPLLFTPDASPDARQIFIEAEFAEHPPTKVPSSITDRALPSVDEAKWTPVKNSADAGRGLVIRPGGSFVYGQESSVVTEGLYALSSRRMSDYQVHLLIGEGRWASSAKMKRNFIVNDEVWDFDPIAYVESASTDLKVPIRKIDINGVMWLFEGTSRLCIIPDGSDPEISTFENREFVRIVFPDTEEMDVVTSNRNGDPISGSERTVPHLHLWKSLTERPMGIATNATSAEASTVRFPRPSGGRALPSEQSAPAPSEESRMKAAWWPWMAASAALFLTALWTILRKST